jgi:hypothetical protein
MLNSALGRRVSYPPKRLSTFVSLIAKFFRVKREGSNQATESASASEWIKLPEANIPEQMKEGTMTKQALTMIALMVLVGSLAASANAQSLSTDKLIANIPFAFGAGNQTLPAGEYIIRCVNPASGQTVLQITSKDGRNRVMLHMTSKRRKTSETSQIVFHQYGDRYFFAQVWTSGERDGLEAPKARAERKAIRELVRVKSEAKTITLVAGH